MRLKRLAVRLGLWVSLCVTLIFSVILYTTYTFSRQIITENLRHNAETLAHATVNRIDKVLMAVEKVPTNLSHYMEYFNLDDGELLGVIREVVANNPEIYGATIAFEPFAYNETVQFFAPYYYRNGDSMEFTYITHDYFPMDWYQIPKELNRAVWSEPYFDEGVGNVIMATYSVPFYSYATGGKRLRGIVTADISLDWLQDIIASIKISQTGYGFLLTKNGTFVTHPNKNIVMNESIFSLAEARDDPDMRELGRQMIKGRSGFVPFTSEYTGKQCWMVYKPLGTSGWSLGVLFPQVELMADVHKLTGVLVILSVMGFVALLMVIGSISGTITRPIRLLATASRRMATGQLDIEMPKVTTHDEVGALATSFDHMRQSLKQYIRDLTETTAAKERIESELQIAREIQMGILPKTFPPFGSRKDIDLFATMEPAKEVGGDLYDFFLLDDHHLCFTIGDVSGKGVPAALFMAVTKTLIKTTARKEQSAAEILHRVNEDLSMDNPSSMFVTLFLGILDTRTGLLSYANGGHNPPYCIRANGRLESIDTTGDIILGAMQGVEYHVRQMQFEAGDTLFLYTDGVTESVDKAYREFGMERLAAILAASPDRPLTRIIEEVMAAVTEFSAGIEQADDITMLVVRYDGTAQLKSDD